MKVKYITEPPCSKRLYALYNYLGWNDFLKLSGEELSRAMKQSWYVIYAYDEKDNLIGTGRVISDGMINAYLCGLCVHPDYRNHGIGSEILDLLVHKCSEHNLHIQLFCEEHLVSYYKDKGFNTFAIGMKKS